MYSTSRSSKQNAYVIKPKKKTYSIGKITPSPGLPKKYVGIRRAGDSEGGEGLKVKSQKRRILNSWEREHGQVGDEDINEDIKEELVDDRSEEVEMREEGSAALRLIDSLSKFEDFEEYESDQGGDDDSRDFGKIDVLRKAQKDSKLALRNRPYSPPFSQFSGKSK